MEKKKIVVALGGNALGNTPKEQLELVKKTAVPIVDLIEAGHSVIIAHGNGPQVGMINLAMEQSNLLTGKTPSLEFPECGAMSQGYIGFHLQNAIREELCKRNINIPVATVITQVIVDSEDVAFKFPTKPIGSFYTEKEAMLIQSEKGYKMVEDAGRGWRRVVPSPRPLDIAEKETIKTLMDNKHIVIAVGGGGIPVVIKDHRLIGVSAVIDKDFASAKLAEIIDADFIIILTAVEKVALNYGKPNEKWLAEISVDEAIEYSKEGHFAPGSMLPKMEAAIQFASSRKGRSALITSLDMALEGINGRTGTIINL